MVDFILNAQVRSDLGKGASRRLRRNAGLVPAVVYGGDKEPQSVTLELREIAKLLENEAAFSHVIALNVGGAKETVLIKALQRHPAKGFVMHADFLRVVADHKLTAHVPLARSPTPSPKSKFPACRKTCRNSSKSTWPRSSWARSFTCRTSRLRKASSWYNWPTATTWPLPTSTLPAW